MGPVLGLQKILRFLLNFSFTNLFQKQKEKL